MGDEKLKQELLYIVKISSKYDFHNKDVVENILRMENERQILTSVFGKRFKARIFDIAYDQEHDGKCIICGNIANETGTVCNDCIEKISGSPYAKSVLKSDEVVEKSSIFKSKVWPILSKFILACLVLVLIIQLAILGMWLSIPTRNPKVDPYISKNELVAVNDSGEALEQVLLDYPKDQGYSVSFIRLDQDYVGRFNNPVGESSSEIEEALTDEERYDYFFQEPVYVFHVTYSEKYAVKVGVVEVNADGKILVEGQFNDGRDTHSFYRIR
ncbi:MAG: hypothetical protein K6E79_01265 [Pseudobutyrivibrio sp.]|nr:hypothetical protein [Pseudobutyrivibrio sp.]